MSIVLRIARPAGKGMRFINHTAMHTTATITKRDTSADISIQTVRPQGNYGERNTPTSSSACVPVRDIRLRVENHSHVTGDRGSPHSLRKGIVEASTFPISWGMIAATGLPSVS